MSDQQRPTGDPYGQPGQPQNPQHHSMPYGRQPGVSGPGVGASYGQGAQGSYSQQMPGGAPGQPGSQRPYGQPGPGQYSGPVPPPPYNAPQKPPSKAPKIMIVVGAILMAVSVVLFVLFATQLMSAIPSEDDVVTVNGPTEVQITGGEMKVIYASDVSVGCDVTGPTADVPDVTLRISMNWGRNGENYTGIGKVGGDGQPDGTYTVECDGDGVVIAPPISIPGITTSVLSAVVGGFAGLIGLVLLIVGLVLRAGQKKRVAA